MAIALNKHAIRCEEIAIASGKITSTSSATPILYDISRDWRKLLESTAFVSLNSKEWSEREESAGELVVSALTYLQRIGCRNIEQLLRDTIERLDRMSM